MDRLGAAKHVGDDVGAMQPRQHVPAVADAAMDEGHVVDRIERRQEGVAGQRADLDSTGNSPTRSISLSRVWR